MCFLKFCCEFVVELCELQIADVADLRRTHTPVTHTIVFRVQWSSSTVTSVMPPQLLQPLSSERWPVVSACPCRYCVCVCVKIFKWAVCTFPSLCLGHSAINTDLLATCSKTAWTEKRKKRDKTFPGLRCHKHSISFTVYISKITWKSELSQQFVELFPSFQGWSQFLGLFPNFQFSQIFQLINVFEAKWWHAGIRNEL